MSNLPRILEEEVMDTDQEVEAYDRMDHEEPKAAFVERLIELGARGLILDIGTGPGHFPLHVCEKIEGCHVVGIDMAHKMLEVADTRRLGSPFADRIEYRIGNAKQIEDSDNTYDVVCSNTILHHIPKPVDMLREAWRVLKPNGVLLIRDLYRPRDANELDRIVSEHAADCDAYQKRMFAESLHAALTPDELQHIATEAGMTGVQVVVDTDRHMSLQTSVG